jgi:hypothetical protein
MINRPDSSTRACSCDFFFIINGNLRAFYTFRQVVYIAALYSIVYHHFPDASSSPLQCLFVSYLHCSDLSEGKIDADEKKPFASVPHRFKTDQRVRQFF